MNFVCKKKQKNASEKQKKWVKVDQNCIFLPKNAREKQKQVKVKPVSD